MLVSLTPFRMPLRDQAFLSWAGLRGAVPIVLATVPATLGTADAARIFDLVFVLVVIFTLVQAPTLPWVARRLGLAESVRSVDLDVETTPLETMGADVLQVTVGERSRLHGVELFELRLPPGANVTLVVRDGEGFVPHGQHRAPARRPAARRQHGGRAPQGRAADPRGRRGRPPRRLGLTVGKRFGSLRVPHVDFRAA